MLAYVDDMTVTGNSVTHVQELIAKLNDRFSLKQLGNLEYFLGIEVSHLKSGNLFFLKQSE